MTRDPDFVKSCVCLLQQPVGSHAHHSHQEATFVARQTVKELKLKTH